LGSFYITNVRIVWFANLAENFNVSLPWIQVKNIKVRESKFGTALVIETSDFSGGYILGFKLDNLDTVYTEITGLYKTYSQNPIFGVECTFEDACGNLDEVTIPRAEDDVSIISTDYSESSSIHHYLVSQQSKGEPKDIIFSQEIGKIEFYS
jgi:Bardet-Biedl syndrome 5 protein